MELPLMNTWSLTRSHAVWEALSRRRPALLSSEKADFPTSGRVFHTRGASDADDQFFNSGVEKLDGPSPYANALLG